MGTDHFSRCTSKIVLFPVNAGMRKPRVLQEGARYHVFARAHQSRHILVSVGDKELFLDVVTRAKAKFGFRLESLCLLNHHFHAIVVPVPGTSLSRIFQWILGVFAQSWNRRHELCDRVWGQRFFSRIIDGVGCFVRTVLSMDHEPVKAHLSLTGRGWPFGRDGLRRRAATRGLIDEPPIEFAVDLALPWKVD